MLRLAGISAAALLVALGSPAFAQKKPEAKNMALVGYNDLQARSAYQPIVHRQGNRWIAYIGHHGGTDDVAKPVNPMTGKAEDNGTSVVDVTDPKHPRYLVHIPGEPGLYEGGGGQMVRACDGKDLPKGDRDAVYLLRTFGKSAHEIWDVRDPAHPRLVTRIAGLRDTHKNFWECDTGIAYLVSGEPGWRVTRMTQVYDLSDPAHPVKIRDFGLPGQQPGSTGPTPINLHGMISMGPKVNRVYFGYGTNSNGVMQIVDREKLLTGPKEPTEENLRYPEVGRWELSPFNGAHTVFPILNMPIRDYAKDGLGKSRNIAVVTDEQIANECGEARQMAWFVDMTSEKHPIGISNFQVPEKQGDFCDRGGRFGTHSSNENMTPIYYGKIMFFAYFNAGVRAVDIRDPYHPREIGHYIPAVTANTDKRCVKIDSGEMRCKIAIQTNNVEVDDRGYIYIVDRANTGMHILELTGDARKTASLPPASSLAAR